MYVVSTAGRMKLMTYFEMNFPDSLLTIRNAHDNPCPWLIYSGQWHHHYQDFILEYEIVNEYSNI